MKKFDFLVVGSGAAGAASAWRLTQNGYDVACLERGDWKNPASYPSNFQDWEIKKHYFNPVAAKRQQLADYPIDDNNSPIAICNYNAVGGSTVLFSGHFPRFQPRDFRLRTEDNVAEDWPISYEDLRPYYEINEYEMSASGLVGDPFYPDIESLLPPVPIGRAGAIVASGFNTLGWHWWPSYAAISTKNVRGRNACLNLGPCNTGCPQGAKSSTDVTYIPKAIKNGLSLYTNAAVYEIIIEDDRAVGARYHDVDGRVKELYADNVILAASAIGSAKILLNSKSTKYPHGLGNEYDLVGRNLMVHPLGYVEGLFEEILDTDKGPQGCMLYSLEHYRSPDKSQKLGYMLHVLRGSAPVETAVTAFKRRALHFGSQLYVDFFKHYRKKLFLSVICEDLPEPKNRVLLDHKTLDRFGVPGVSVHYELGENTKKLIVDGMKEGRRLLQVSGALRTTAYGPVRETGWHTLGTTRMGLDERNSVVNEFGQVHNVRGLFVVDSGCFVTASCVNPANTIQALSLYLTDKLIERSVHEA